MQLNLKRVVTGLGVLAVLTGIGWVSWKLYRSSSTQSSNLNAPPPPHQTITIESDMPGSGQDVRPGMFVSLDYQAFLVEGNQLFDSSAPRRKLYEFVAGAAQALPGLDQAVIGMKKGGHRVVIIPWSLGYGASGVVGLVPPRANLRYAITLVDVKAHK